MVLTCDTRSPMTSMRLPFSNDPDHDPGPRRRAPKPDDVLLSTDPAMDRLKNYAKSVPYSIEPNSKMQALLDFFLMRITQCVQSKDYDPGFIQWDSMLT